MRSPGNTSPELGDPRRDERDRDDRKNGRKEDHSEKIEKFDAFEMGGRLRGDMINAISEGYKNSPAKGAQIAEHALNITYSLDRLILAPIPRGEFAREEQKRQITRLYEYINNAGLDRNSYPIEQFLEQVQVPFDEFVPGQTRTRGGEVIERPEMANAKKIALDTLRTSGPEEALLVMMSELSKNSANSPGMELGLGMAFMGDASNAQEVKRFIQGFH